jgi:antitoxin (DNA-binding transcriptional repressor) of toxin-antitoxin stability system
MKPNGSMRAASEVCEIGSSGEVLRSVAAVESMVITNHGQPAALLTPVPGTVRERLIAAGRLVPAEKAFASEGRPRPHQLRVRLPANSGLNKPLSAGSLS